MRNRALVATMLLGLCGGGVPAAAQEGSAWHPYSLTRSLDERRVESALSLGAFGSRLDLGPFDLGVKVAPRRPSLALGVLPQTAGWTSRYRLLTETDLTLTDIGLDLRLRWPSLADTETRASGLRPYVSLGPALSVPIGEEPLTLGRSVTRAETPRALGMRGALGLAWQLAPDAALFGEYRLTQDHPFSRRATDDVGVDLFYGFSLRF